MAGDEDARYVLGGMEAKSKSINVERAANHLRIAESIGWALFCNVNLDYILRKRFCYEIKGYFCAPPKSRKTERPGDILLNL